MARRNKTQGLDVLVEMITIIITLIVGLIVGIFKLISGFFELLFNCEKKLEKQSNSNKIKIKNNKPKVKLRELEKYVDKGPVTIYEEEIIKIPSREIKTPYDDLFKPQIKSRGINYFIEGNVINYKFDGQICSGEIIGTETYNTSISFYKNKNIKKVSCSCLYFKKDNSYCKHIYTLLLKYCKKENVDGFVDIETYREVKQKKPKVNHNYYNRMLEICYSMKEIINNTENFYNSDEVIVDIDIEDIYKEIMSYQEKINYYSNIKIGELSEELIESAKEDLYELENLYENLGLEYEEILENIEEEKLLEQEEDLIDEDNSYFMNDNIDEEKYELEYEREELRNTWGLFDHEIDEVQKGDYDPWQFEEDSEDEDDYYYEDED